jgi:monothiol glutaredoxin
MDSALKDHFDKLIASHDVVLFMKGNRQFPQCGFSSKVVKMLNSIVPKYETVNVLADGAVREGIKEYSNWPTIPQLYIKGQFVGGCDIVTEMFEAGELQAMLGAKASAPVSAPTTLELKVTPAAAEALARFMSEADPGELIRVEVDDGFEHALSFGPREPGDLEVAAGSLKLLVKPQHAARLNGTSIDYVSNASGAGFRIDNPNAPARVLPLSATELQKWITDGRDVLVIDVRPEDERRIASLPFALPLDGAGGEALASASVDKTLVFHCHHGIRSRRAAEQVLERGFKKLFNLEGGIDAWSRTVDPKVPTY